MNKIDGSYRLLFGNPLLVRDLFEGVIGQPWVKDLDWTGLRPLPPHYISNSLRQRQGDGVWYLPRDDGTTLFLLLMLEHQSTSDRMMALRLSTYCALLYENLLAAKLVSRNTRLPIILPVVLYSGVKRWSAPRTMAELIDTAPRPLAMYRLQMRYLLVDEGTLVRRGNLPRDNLAALLFRLEHNKGIEDVQDLMQTVWDRTHGPEYIEVRKAFTAWARHVLLPRALPNISFPAVDDLLEIKAILTENSRSWTHQWKEQGLLEGRREGRQEGRQEGASRILQRLLERKFGTVPGDVQTRLTQATPAELETWSLNVLDASTLDEVFGR